MKVLLLLLMLCFGFTSNAQRFDAFFTDATLRIDYVFAGNHTMQQAYIGALTQTNNWHGRKGQLGLTAIQGDAQLRVYDKRTNKLIYVVPFGSLFQEWLTQPDAKQKLKSFENSFLIPFPKNEVIVKIVFFDNHNTEKTISTETINPQDILIRKSTKVPFYEVVHNAKVQNPIKIVLVAEGYKADEKDVFMQFVHKTVENLFKHSIFNRYKDYFEIVAVPLVSKDSNVSIPSKNEWRDTAVNSNFDTFYSSRYLTTSSVHHLHQNLENIPYHHIIILANTDVYGGGGILNSYSLTTTKNKEFAPVVVHEFGHSFAGLADEYFYTNDVFVHEAEGKVEPWEKNITSLVAFENKWKSLLEKDVEIPTNLNVKDKSKLGAYEGLKGNGLYIPTLNCRMKQNNTNDFCTVCNNAIEEMILFYTAKQEN